MFRGGSVLRLIDVCFNILIGFICITDRQLKSRLDLPPLNTGGAQTEIIRMVEVYIGTDTLRTVDEKYEAPDGSVKWEKLPSWSYHISWDQDGASQERDASDGVVLKSLLQELRDRPARIEKVVVVSDDDAPVGGTVVVYDVCKELRLALPEIDLTLGTAP
ncbi:MAG: hypothetical protein NT025_09480 [bacterium]|nr:hypothetical protein [bacterium]